MSRQFLELRDDVGRSCEVPLAAPRRFLRAFEARAAAKLHFDAHRVAVGCALRGDGRVWPDFDLFRERHALRVGDGCVGELLDAAIALQEVRGDAERQVELRGRQALRLVLPADVIRRDLRAVHDDLLYVFGTERLAGLELPQSVQGRVVACAAGVELERDAHRLPGLAEARGELGEPEAIV